MSNRAVPALWMRGGTSRGGFFLATDLPQDVAARDAFLLRVMGSPDPRQIDGLGGGDPLTCKVAVVKRSEREGVDVDYLFLQVFVDQAIVTDAQNCGNMLMGVGPFALERGLATATGDETSVTIFMENTGQIAVSVVQTPGGRVAYQGAARIDGVPGTAAPVAVAFRDTSGSACGALLPTGRTVDVVDGVRLTLIDNGMPCVVMKAVDLGVTGYETRAELDADDGLKARLESIRLQVGPMMNLGDVSALSTPKMMLLAPPRDGGAVCVRSLIPHRCHASVGVLAAVTTATACLLEGSPAAEVAQLPEGRRKMFGIEHPSGLMECRIDLDAKNRVEGAAIVSTARKLFDGVVYG